MSTALIFFVTARIPDMSETSARINFGFEPNCDKIALAADSFHPTMVILADGQCRAIARPIPDVSPTITTFGGGFKEDRIRAFEAVAARTAADIFND
ncbi:unnamed protein product [Rotaria sp. Silwood1]|nr:unnamed protein product [Rotaria sp. Silwood1]CAF3670809.1 unnamed protein product [Rotaria sp. Silwood1]CAF3687352.1 unnamed protein product [Rotaria sp. Silwood1]CAF4914036.1 unnamed protein product [Rotaria sp. Silwood1]CAF4915996.1 unnamed protein product [Rotaria sp. Silwood1]